MRQTVTRVITALIIAGALTASRGPAHAFGERVACTPDVFRLCSAEAPNVDHILACLKREKARLSQVCRAAIDPGR